MSPLTWDGFFIGTATSVLALGTVAIAISAWYQLPLLGGQLKALADQARASREGEAAAARRQQRQTRQMYFHRGLFLVTTEEEAERIQRNKFNPSNTQTTTICLGEHLLVHAISSSAAPDVIRRWKMPPEFLDGLVEIWPVRRGIAAWPPRRTFNDLGIETLANDFYEKAIATVRWRRGPVPF